MLRQTTLQAVRRLGVQGVNVTRSQPAATVAAGFQENALVKGARLGRPISPHVTIYEINIAWIVSGAFRVAAAAMATGVFAGASAYGLAQQDANTIINAVQDLHIPSAAIVAAKFTVAAPFTFHVYNGIRHLMWDRKINVSNPGVKSTGIAVLGLTAVTSIALSLV